jgi:hypothetical protein
MRSIITLALCLGLGASASAQMTSGQTTGTFSGQYQAPSWGNAGTTTWGSYSGSVGQGGWTYNRTMRPQEPAGSVLLPNQSGSSFANPRTGADLFTPPSTQYKGRDRP